MWSGIRNQIAALSRWTSHVFAHVMLHRHVQVREVLGASCILESNESLSHGIRILLGLYGGLMLGWVVRPIRILEASFSHLIL